MKLRLVSYNIHRAIGNDRRFRPDRITAVLERYDADLIMLQEVDEGAPRSREMDLARDMATQLGYPHFAIGHNVSLRKGRYGNATLSRYPIVRERNIDLTIGRRKRRGCQHTSLLVERRLGHPHSLEVFNLHLGLSAHERQRQAGLLAHSKELAGLAPQVPCILGGDFNDWRSHLRAYLLEGLGFQCATDRVQRGRVRSLKTYPAFSPQAGLDRIYYRGHLRLLHARRGTGKTTRMASDHLPVIIEFELT